jgi:Tfp pilus assembly protein FimT
MTSARGEQGFTLVELLVVMVAGIAVLGAIFTILDVTLHQTTRTFSTIDASQQARTSLEQLEQELHSSCLGANVTPVQPGSTNSTLVFVSQYGSTASAANAPSPTPVQHTITFNQSAHTLTDTTTAASGGSAPTWTFGGASTSRPLLSNVYVQNSTTPVFQYFAYATPMNGAAPYTDAANNPYQMLIDGINAVPGLTPAVIPPAAPLSPLPLSTAQAQSTAEVLIKMLVGPAGGDHVNTNLGDANASITNQIVMRLTPPDNHTGGGATFTPCQ